MFAFGALAPAANSLMPFFGNGFHRFARKEEPEELY
jgi:hypothetical protein